jgi:hypothetical protein
MSSFNTVCMPPSTRRETRLTPLQADQLTKPTPLQWSKGMSYLLTMSIHRQRTSKEKISKEKISKEKINWPPVLELVNATFTRFQSFVLAYPNGLQHLNILSVQYKERHREDGAGSLTHRVRSKAWVPALDLCSAAEKKEFMRYFEDLVEAERALSLTPGSTVMRNIEVPRVSWIEFNVPKSLQERHATYYKASSPEDEDGDQEVQGGDPEMEHEAMGQLHEEIADGEGMEQEEEQDEQTWADVAGPSTSRFAPAKSSFQPATGANALIGGAPSTGGVFSGTSTGNPGSPFHSSGVYPAAYYPTYDASGRPVVAQTTLSEDLSFSLDGTLWAEARNRLSTEDNVKAREGLNKLIGKLHSWPLLPMIHTKKVDSTTGKPIITIRAASFKRKQAEEVFVDSTSPVYNFAGRVYKVQFKDAVTGQSAETDVLLCSEKYCAVCDSTNACLAEVISLLPGTRPVIHEDDMTVIPRQGPTFAPGRQSREANTLSLEHSYVLHVVFTGGKRFLVDVAY